MADFCCGKSSRGPLSGPGQHRECKHRHTTQHSSVLPWQQLQRSRCPASPSSQFMSIFLNLCWTAAQQAGEKPFCSRSNRKRQGRVCGGDWGWG